jgi:type IV secretory pathway VirB4 component
VKDWIKRWLNTEKPSKHDFEDLASAAITSLADAQKAHISDLRVLIDKGAEREEKLAAMVQMAMEHQFYRPVISGKAPENKQTPAIAVEHLQDVATFDDAEDAEEIRKHDELTRELEALVIEQNEKGVHKVGA